MFLQAVGMRCSMHAITLAALLQMTGTLAVVCNQNKDFLEDIKRTFYCFISLGHHFLLICTTSHAT